MNFLKTNGIMRFESETSTNITFKTKQNEQYVEDFMIKIVVLLDVFLESVLITRHYILFKSHSLSLSPR